MELVIVESPTKAKTIGKFLGKNYKVESSFGHVRDLPKSKIGIDVEKNFEPHYIIPVKARKNVTALKKLAAKADKVILATDEDREGEAIAWHLNQALALQDAPKDKVKRIVFHEITESAIQEALAHPRTIDERLVNAQQARRVLDRLVGYMLSPFLWKKIMRGLSAGRVQSVALRLIVEREEEIKRFKPDEYWTISALLQKEHEKNTEFEANVTKINGEALDKLGIKNKEHAEQIHASLEKAIFHIAEITKRQVKRNPNPPFTTSTLQQEANKRLRFSAKQTMRFAQHLYENGFITYMRTDSVNLSNESLIAASKWIKESLGKEYVGEPRIFKTKSRMAQEAHEAIRPTDPFRTPESLETDEAGAKKLYDLIWRRFVASQLPQALFDATSIIVSGTGTDNKAYELSASGTTLRFDGFLKVWPHKFEEKELPALTKNDELQLLKIKPEQHFTEPPPRYNEASLIKALEAFGIGRPSTYAPTLSVIQTRNYVEKNEARRFQPTEIGMNVNKMLSENFPEIVDIQFTARMEEGLDNVAEGNEEWQRLIGDFYTPFAKNLAEKYESVQKSDIAKEEKTDEICDKCGKPMVIKTGRFGKFLACSGFPECKNTKSLKKNIGLMDEKGERMHCPKCSTGEIIRKRTKRGRFFYGCSRYPDCDYASWVKPGEEKKKEEKEESPE